MTTYTPKLLLPLPAFDSTLWQDQYYTAMRIIDAAVGLFTSLPGFRGIWANSTAYAADDIVLDSATAQIYVCQAAHTSPASGTFAAARLLYPAYWRVFNPAATNRGAWAASTAYEINDFVLAAGTVGSVYACCVAAHTSSGVFTDDLAAGYWTVLIDFGTSLTWGGTQNYTGATMSVAAPAAAASPTTKTYVDTLLALKADLASPALTGSPTGPTAALNTNTNQLATCAFVVTQIISTGLSLVLPGQTAKGGQGLVTNGTSANWGRPITLQDYQNFGGF